MPKVFLLAAGFPASTLAPLLQKIKKANADIELIPTLPLKTQFYTTEYVEALYGMAASRFKGILSTDRKSPWNINFVLLYMRKGHDYDRRLTERFDMETLLIPIAIWPHTSKAPRKHKEHVLVNQLFQQSNMLLRNARQILRSLAHEVTNRDTRTCILLPRSNFGSQFNAVKNSVHSSVETTEAAAAIDDTLTAVENGLPRNHEGRFIGRGLAFHAPAKAAARHGMAPLWCMGGHNARCVIRGRIRFGVCYDPNFHYDCNLDRSKSRRFVSCHGEKVLKPGRKHVNVAPNDNIR